MSLRLSTDAGLPIDDALLKQKVENDRPKVSICGLDMDTVNKAVHLRQFYKTDDGQRCEPLVCKVCRMQLSSSNYIVSEDETFLRLELM